MKAIILLLLLVVIDTIQAETDRKDFGKKLSKHADDGSEPCLKESGAKREDIENCKRGIFKEDINLKKYVACIFVKAKVMDPVTGKLDLDGIYENSPPHLKSEIPKYFRNCEKYAKDNADINERLFEIYKCFYQMNPETFVIY